MSEEKENRRGRFRRSRFWHMNHGEIASAIPEIPTSNRRRLSLDASLDLVNPIYPSSPPWQHPATLPARFNLPSTPVASEYDIVWKSDQLGITLHRRDGQTVVKATTNLDVCVGDVLVAIDRRSTRGMDYSEVMQVLRDISKPVTLTFFKDMKDEQLEESMHGEMTAENARSERRVRHLVETDALYKLLTDHHAMTAVGDSILNTNLSCVSACSTLAFCVCANCSTQRVASSNAMTKTATSASNESVMETSTLSSRSMGCQTDVECQDAATSMTPRATSSSNIAVASLVQRNESQAVVPSMQNPNPPSRTIDVSPVVALVDPGSSSQTSGQPTSPAQPPRGGYSNFFNYILASLTSPNRLRAASEASSSIKSPRSHVYTVSWSSGKLGLVLRNHRDRVLIAEVDSSAQVISTEFQVDDKLIAIDTIRVRDVGFHAAIQLLQSMAKPVSLTFRRHKS
ncbi:hypothetical protein AC1031_002877 [Aphanomyces cochlioides]|nr:hypothetical protein AC1031_002877 [Aphanomyces cochlioides]